MTRITGQTTIGALIDRKIAKGAPSGTDTFTYVDISSIDTSSKTISSPKSIAVAEAPSRARQHLRRDDVVVSMTRPNLNAVAMVTPEFDGAVGSTGLCILRSEDVLPKWLYYRVQAADFIVSMTEITQGVLYPAVKTKDIHDFQVVVPSLAEQQAIVDEIETQFARLDDAESALRRVEVRLDNIRGSLIDSILSNTLSQSPKVSSHMLEELLQHLTSGSRDWKPYYDSGESMFILAQNVRPMRFDSTIYQTVDPPKDDSAVRRTRVRAGDLLMTIVGNAGDCCVVEGELEVPMYVCQSVALVRPDSRIHSKFLLYYLNGPIHGNRQIRDRAYGVGRAHISFKDLRTVKIRLPSIDLQRDAISRIEAGLSSTDFARAEVVNQIARIAHLRQAILKNAFEGNYGQ